MDDTRRQRPAVAGASTVVAIRPRFVLEVIGWVLLAVVALIVIGRSRHVLELVLLAIVLAILLRAPINALDRRVPRWAATAIVVIASIGAVVGLLALGSVQLSQEIDVVGDAVTERIESVEPDSPLGQFLVDGRVAERIGERLDELPSQVILGSPDPADGARLGLEALLVFFLMLYALVNGPKLARSALGGDVPRWWAQFVRDGVAAGASQVRRLLALATISGLLGLAIASLFGLPGTTVLALWVGLWAVVPIFGPVVGYTPLVVLASLDGWPNAFGVAILASLIALASWYADRHLYSWDLRSTGSRTGPFGLIVALVVGFQFGWLVGPLVAIFLMAAVVSTMAAFGARERRTAPEPPTDQPDEHDQSSGLPGVSRWRHLDVRSAAIATTIVVVVIVIIALVVDLAPVPAWIIIGVVLAMALDPLVQWLTDHTVLGRGAAVGAVVVGFLAIVAMTLVFAVPSIVQSVRDLDDELPRIAADLEGLPVIGDELAERGVAERLQTTLEEAPDRLASDTGPLERTLRSIGDGLVATFWILLITVTGVIDGQRIRDGLRNLLPAERRKRFERVDSIVGDVVARYAVGSLVIAAIAGTAVFTIALVGGVPLAPLLGLWAAMSNFIPQLGGFIGGAPLVVLALTTGTTKGLVILVVYLMYMQIENRLIQPVIVSKAVDIPPFIAMVAVLIGGAAAGVVGALLVTPFVGVAKSLLNPGALAPRGPRRGRAARRG
ncbi:MAG TPA: AI-2E family transporter [Ilumatobacteraceae bacterium]|nr:AI-2E family transporter [Ilumatobacteraceae bacterium]